ncbi:MAG: SPASM domain-containing protein [Paludibacter sp.]|nr:SPASM domain-containing protein [Paludibacter sp.]
MLICLYQNIEKISLTLRINYDNQTLKKQQAEQILNDIAQENRGKVHIDLQRVWQTTEPNKNNSNEDVESLVNTAKNVGYKKISCAGGINAGQFYNCYASKYHYVELNYDGKVYKCTARDYKEPYEMGELKDDGNIEWNEERISKLYSTSTFDNPVCPKCAYLPLCWGPCPQKMVEMKELKAGGYCVVKDIERSMRERIIDSYESSVKYIQENVIA